LIIAAAAEIFAVEAYEAVNVGEVAKRAGVAHGSVFYHFKDKRGLFVATLVSLLAELDRYVAPKEPERAESTEAVIRGSLGRYFEYVGRYPAAMIALLRIGQHDPDLRTPYVDARALGLGRILSALGVSAHPPPPLLRAALRGWMGFTDELAADWLTHGQDLSVDECVQLCFDALISALHSVDGHRPEPVGLARVVRGVQG
jgi:AcrR family transcriptional regulator